MKPYYEEHGIKVYHGDCLDVVKKLRNIDLVITSPPYNQLGKRITSRGSGIHVSNGGKWLKRIKDTGYADDMYESDYDKWLTRVFDTIADKCTPDASLFFNHKCRWRDKSLIHPIHLVDKFKLWKTRQEIIWARLGSTTFNAKLFFPSDERIYWMTKGREFEFNNKAGGFMSIWRVNQDSGGFLNNKYDKVIDDHPCPFPVEIPSRCIVACSDNKSVILDPFAGSGSTLIAARLNNRQAIGIDLEERYCEIMAKRLSKRGLVDEFETASRKLHKTGLFRDGK